jgi:hypothetical protein
MTGKENAPGASANSTGGNDENLGKDSVNIDNTEHAFEELMGAAGMCTDWIVPEWATNRADGFFMPYGDPCATWESDRFGIAANPSLTTHISRVDSLTLEGAVPGSAKICIEYAGQEIDLELSARQARSLALALMDAAECYDLIEGRK